MTGIDYSAIERHVIGNYAGMKLVESDVLPVSYGWDYSACRSPARARRRHAQGIPNKQVTQTKVTEAVQIGDTLFVPRGYLAKIGERLSADKDRQFFDALYGGGPFR